MMMGGPGVPMRWPGDERVLEIDLRCTPIDAGEAMRILEMDPTEYHVACMIGTLERSIRHPLRDFWETAFHSATDLLVFEVRRVIEQLFPDVINPWELAERVVDETCFLRDVGAWPTGAMAALVGELTDRLCEQISCQECLGCTRGLADARMQVVVEAMQARMRRIERELAVEPVPDWACDAA